MAAQKKMKLNDGSMDVYVEPIKNRHRSAVASPIDIPEILEKIILKVDCSNSFRQAAKLEGVCRAFRDVGWIGIRALNIRRQPHTRIVLNEILLPESQELEVLTNVWKKCINVEDMQIQGFANDFRFSPDGPAIYGGAAEFGRIMELLIKLNTEVPRDVQSLELRYVPLLSCLVPLFISSCAGTITNLSLRWLKTSPALDSQATVLHYDRFMCLSIGSCRKLEELTILQPVCNTETFQNMFRHLRVLRALNLTELRTHDRHMIDPLVNILEVLESENHTTRFHLKLDKLSLLAGLETRLVASSITSLELESTGDLVESQLFPCFPNLNLCHLYDAADSNTNVVACLMADFLHFYAPTLDRAPRLTVEAVSQGYLTSDTPEKTRKILKILKNLTNVVGQIQAEQRFHALIRTVDFYTQKRLLRVQGYLAYNFQRGNAFATLKLHGKVGY